MDLGEILSEKADKPVTKVSGMAYLKHMGVTVLEDDCVSVNIFRPGASSLRLNLYKDNRLVQQITIPSLKEVSMDDFFSARLYGENLIEKLDAYTYDFVADGEHFVNSSAEIISGRDSFGKKGKLRARFVNHEFDWSSEKRKLIAPEDMVIYETHVRGFTKHKSSGVKHPGTFAGMIEKLPYLKKLGVNTLFMLPVYDFDELDIRESAEDAKRVNYWGYTGEAFYFAPKASYSSDPLHPGRELKELIKQIHRQGMNIVLDMFFMKKAPDFVLDCLRHYVVNYHVDGFRVMSDFFNAGIVRDDPILSHVRFFGYGWEESNADAKKPMLFEMNDGFKEIARRYVKSDEGQVDAFYRSFRAERTGVVKVNYITAHDGFTLRDLISYDIKHNEANGEKNRDGTDYNYSWNCGFEGPTRRKGVLSMRTKQEKNILVMLLLGLPVPMILMGDEFGNTQKGNNNAYCLDNQTTWLDWTQLEKNKETYDCVRFLLKLRRELPIFHRQERYSGFDHKGLGAPDISNHSREPWNNNYPYYCRELGILYYGPYLGAKEGKSYYFAFNMHWEPHDFYLPDITKAKKWEVILDTAANIRKTPGLNETHTAFSVEPRSVVLLECPEDKPVRKKGKVKNDSTSDRKHKGVSKSAPVRKSVR